MASILSKCCLEDLGVIHTSIKSVLLLSTFSIFGSNLLLFKQVDLKNQHLEELFSRLFISSIGRFILIAPAYYFLVSDIYQFIYIVLFSLIEIPIKLIAAIAVSKGDIIYNQTSDYSLPYLFILLAVIIGLDINTLLFKLILGGRMLLLFWYLRYIFNRRIRFIFSLKILEIEYNHTISRVGLLGDIFKNMDGLILLILVSELHQGYFAVIMLPFTLISVLMAIINQSIVKPIGLIYSNEELSLFINKSLLIYRRLIPAIIVIGAIFYFLIFEFELWELPFEYFPIYCLLIFAQLSNFYAGPAGLILTLSGFEKKMQNLLIVGIIWILSFSFVFVSVYSIVALCVIISFWMIIENFFKLKWLRAIVDK